MIGKLIKYLSKEILLAKYHSFIPIPVWFPVASVVPSASNLPFNPIEVSINPRIYTK